MAHRMLTVAAAVAAAAVALVGVAASAESASCRDRWQQPFSSDSIWNMPLGSAAQYLPANVYNGFNASWGCALRLNSPMRRRTCKALPPGATNVTEALCINEGCCWDPNPDSTHARCFIPAGGPPDGGFHADQDLLIRASPSDPPTPFLDRAWLMPPHSCDIHGPQRTTLPFPVDFVTDPELNNNAAALLAPDNVTLFQFQPLYRCTPGSPIMAQYPPTCPYPFEAGWNQSILGQGLHGAHGGSFLSSIGGTVRQGELSAGVIPHALKLELFGHDFYWAGYGDNSSATYEPCSQWPATDCDGYARSGGWNGYNGTLPYVRPGSLLAVPPSMAPGISSQLQTQPGRVILTALATYGGYLVDDTAGDSGAVCMEPGAIAELQAGWGISMNITNAVFPDSPGPNGAFFFDLLTIFRALHAVVNNGPNSVGGGGQPIAPLAPPICGAE